MPGDIAGHGTNISVPTAISKPGADTSSGRMGTTLNTPPAAPTGEVRVQPQATGREVSGRDTGRAGGSDGRAASDKPRSDQPNVDKAPGTPPEARSDRARDSQSGLVVTQGGVAATVGRDGQLRVEAAAVQSVNGPNAKAIDRIDVVVGANGQVELSQRPAQSGEVATGLMLVEVRQQKDGFQIEFADFKVKQVVGYHATQLDDTPLPNWVGVDTATGEIHGAPPEGVKTIDLRMMAQDRDGSIRTLDLHIDLEKQKNPVNKGILTPTEPARVTKLEVMPSFTTQLHQARAVHDGYGHALVDAMRKSA